MVSFQLNKQVSAKTTSTIFLILKLFFNEYKYFYAAIMLARYGSQANCSSGISNFQSVFGNSNTRNQQLIRKLCRNRMLINSIDYSKEIINLFFSSFTRNNRKRCWCCRQWCRQLSSINKHVCFFGYWFFRKRSSNGRKHARW